MQKTTIATRVLLFGRNSFSVGRYLGSYRVGSNDGHFPRRRCERIWKEISLTQIMVFDLVWGKDCFCYKRLVPLISCLTIQLLWNLYLPMDINDQSLYD